MTDKVGNMNNNENTDNPIEGLLNEIVSEKMMSEIMESWLKMTEDEQVSILARFMNIYSEKDGEASPEMFQMFHEISMKYSKTYYFLHSLTNEPSEDAWDDALKELS